MRLFLLSLCLAATAFAQDAQLTAKVDAVFASFEKPGSPGCTLGVIKDGKLIYTRGYGMANLEHNIPNGSKLVYDIGSTSKQFTAASILLLAQAGKLSLDDEVRKWIPELPSYPKPVTIRHLLHHTSGLRDYLTLFSLAGINFDDMTSEKDALDLIVRQRSLNFTPGDDWVYSNSGYFLLSIVIKHTSGKSFSEFAKEKIFAPLGMTHTLVLDNHKRIVSMRATGYSPGRTGFQTEMSNFEQTGDGAVLTSVEDLLLWDQNFYHAKVGGPEFLKQMQEVGGFNDGRKHDYAAGLFIDKHKGLRRVSHGGSWAGYRSELVRFPDQKTSVVCLCNLATVNPSQMATQVAELYLADAIKAVTEKPSANAETHANNRVTNFPVLAEEKLKEKIGLYRNPKSGELRRISWRDGKLRMDAFTPVSVELKPMTEQQFEVVGGEGTKIEFSANATKPGLTMTRRGLDETFERVETFTPAAEQLADFVGRFMSEELNTTYRLEITNERLQVIDRNDLKRPLLPTFRDAFTLMSGLQFEFKRDAQGRITGFLVHAGRIRNLRFAKQ